MSRQDLALWCSTVVFVEQRSYFLRYFISPNFRKLRWPLLLARPRRLLCVAFFFYDYFSLTYNSTINFCFHSCVFSFHFSTHRVFYDLPSSDSNFPKADERITIFSHFFFFFFFGKISQDERIQNFSAYIISFPPLAPCTTTTSDNCSNF